MGRKRPVLGGEALGHTGEEEEVEGVLCESESFELSESVPASELLVCSWAHSVSNMAIFSRLSSHCHLRVHVLVVRCAPCLLCTVNVQPLEHLGVIIVCGTKALDRVDVVDKRMELWNV